MNNNKKNSQKNLYIDGSIINSKESLIPYLKEKISHYKPEYKKEIPKDHLILFIDKFIDIATHTILEDQKLFLDKLKAIKKRIEQS